MTRLNKNAIAECFQNRDCIFNIVNESNYHITIDAQDLYYLYQLISTKEYKDYQTEIHLLDDVYSFMDVLLEDFRLDSSNGKKGREWANKKTDEIKNIFEKGYNKNLHVKQLINLINK